MDFDQILKELRSKQYRPVYFLHGQESYFIDEVSHYIEKNVLTESERAFNQTIFYGKEVDHLAIVDTARRYPMMSSHQVVILKEAQEMKGIAELLSYIEKPMESTILVICHKHKRFNFNSRFGKALKKNALVFESKPLYDNQVPAWISAYLKRKKLKITPKASELIAEYLGAELSKVANELDKLAINLPAGTEVNDQHIEANIGISKDYNIFELQRALGQQDVLKANRIINYFAANPKKNPMPVLIGALYSYFSKVYLYHAAKNLPVKELLSTLQLRSEFFLKEYRLTARNYPPARAEKVISLLKEYDLKSKGVGYISTGKPEGELMKELVWRLLH
ncbi:MAG: DNA polymerase III subunit delta [Phaeodactylibacter sp.]|nr:DNA polymerase III subunit delta [Phaeodactylibacter sp.]MCB9267212.1 DNA polymerase III subunit delta [Lewinellaceae bacterium]MCB9291413.1 DNA polymerase III subunit delta [Lewinellaceae bacterium]